MSVHTVHVRNAPERHARSSGAVDRPREPPAGRDARLPAAGSTRTASPDHACMHAARRRKRNGASSPVRTNSTTTVIFSKQARATAPLHGTARPGPAPVERGVALVRARAHAAVRAPGRGGAMQPAGPARATRAVNQRPPGGDREAAAAEPPPCSVTASCAVVRCGAVPPSPSDSDPHARRGAAGPVRGAENKPPLRALRPAGVVRADAVVGFNRHRARPCPIPRRTRGHRCRPRARWPGGAGRRRGRSRLCLCRVCPGSIHRSLSFFSLASNPTRSTPPSYSVQLRLGSSVSVRIFGSGDD
jgi:hypothetical protein